MRGERTLRTKGYTLTLHVTTDTTLHTQLTQSQIEAALSKASAAFDHALTEIRQNDEEVIDGL